MQFARKLSMAQLKCKQMAAMEAAKQAKQAEDTAVAMQEVRKAARTRENCGNVSTKSS